MFECVWLYGWLFAFAICRKEKQRESERVKKDLPAGRIRYEFICVLCIWWCEYVSMKIRGLQCHTARTLRRIRQIASHNIYIYIYEWQHRTRTNTLSLTYIICTIRNPSKSANVCGQDVLLALQFSDCKLGLALGGPFTTRTHPHTNTLSPILNKQLHTPQPHIHMHRLYYHCWRTELANIFSRNIL